MKGTGKGCAMEPAEQLQDAHVQTWQRWADDEHTGAFNEGALNGKPIDWGYWVHQMPSLTAAQAARLMNGLDPDLFASLDDRANDNYLAPACAMARDWQRLAEAQGVHSGTPASWLEWADQQRQPDDANPDGVPPPVHPLYRIEVGKLKARHKRQAYQGEVPAMGASEGELDFTLLATREQLIAAFGTFTGMDMEWFSNLKDTPALLAARKVAGQGGRGHIAQPLFCPFEVMQWLVDPNRKKGRPIQDATAWRMLKNYFPRVHAQCEVGDPNTD